MPKSVIVSEHLLVEGGAVRLTVVDTVDKINRGSEQGMKEASVKQEREVIAL